MENTDHPAAVSRADAEVHRAEGVLAALLDVSIEQAVVSLELQAQFSGMSLVDAAQQVLENHTRRLDDAEHRDDDQTLAILRQHLDQAATPLSAT